MCFRILLSSLCAAIALTAALPARADMAALINAPTVADRDKTIALLHQAALDGDAEAGFACAIGATLRTAERLTHSGMSTEGGLDALFTPERVFQQTMGAAAGTGGVPPLAAPGAYDALNRAVYGDLTQGIACLQAISDPEFGAVVDIAALRGDWNNDGVLATDEAIGPSLAALFEQFGAGGDAASEFRFDQTDVYWLESYLHLTAAPIAFYLSHDTSETFEAIRRVAAAQENPAWKRQRGGFFSDPREVMALGVIATIRWPVVDPDLRRAALTHLEAVPNLARTTWAAAQAETDNDREWLPGPDQTSAMESQLFGDGFRTNTNSVAAWLEMMGTFETILSGERLLPVPGMAGPTFVANGYGFNLRRFILEGERLDLLMLLTLHDIEPFLEQGPLVDNEAFRAVLQRFTLGAGLWYN